MTIRLFRSTDTDAPVLSSVRGSLINVLRKCLIDGYGSKAAVGGWTLEYINVDETIACFRNNPTTGSGSYLKVDGVTTSSPQTYRSYFKAYENMTAIDVGTGPFITNDGNRYLDKSVGTSTDARYWLLVATDTVLSLFILPQILSSNAVETPTTTTMFTNLLHFGDYKSYSTQPNNCILSCTSQYYQTKFGLVYRGFSTNYSFNYTSRNYLGESDTPCLIAPMPFGPSGSTATHAIGPAYDGELLLCNIGLCDNGNVAGFRGTLDNLYYLGHDPVEFKNLQELVIDDRKFIIFLFVYAYSSGYYDALVVEYEED